MNKCAFSPLTKTQYIPRENPVAGHHSKNKASKIALEVLLVLGAILALGAVVGFAVTAVVLINAAFLIGSVIALFLLLAASGGVAKVHTGHFFVRPSQTFHATGTRSGFTGRPVDRSWDPLSSEFGANHDSLFRDSYTSPVEVSARGNPVPMGNTRPGNRRAFN